MNPVRTLHRNDPKEFAVLYDLYYLPVFYFSQKFTGDVPTAEDITADSFVKLWNKALQAEKVENVRAFLFAVARNACLDHLKTKQIHSQKEKEIHYLAQEENRVAAYISEIRAELLMEIKDEIEKLPANARRIFKLSFIEGLKNSEIAERLNLREQTVLNQKAIALKRLRFAFRNKSWVWALLLFVWYYQE